MAGGILSIAADFAGQSTISLVLLAVASIVFIVLVVQNAVRTAIQPACIRDPNLALVLFTWVAACGVLGDSRGPLPENARLAFTAAAVVGWVLALAAVALRLDIGAAGWRGWTVRGTWLLAVVATQSLAILASAGAQQFEDRALWAIGLALWILGLVAYSGLIVLIVRRLATGAVGIETFTPDYWITMGALAISTVAGLDLSQAAASLDSNEGLSDVLKSVTVVTWVGAASWIPYLLLLEVARARGKGLSLRYNPGRWSTVFPFGMFSLASHELGNTVGGLPDLGNVARIAFWVGLAVALFNLGRAPGSLAGPAKRVC